LKLIKLIAFAAVFYTQTFFYNRRTHLLAITARIGSPLCVNGPNKKLTNNVRDFGQETSGIFANNLSEFVCGRGGGGLYHKTYMNSNVCSRFIIEKINA
jgi:hypothetical protein